jgi:hypothetical protein
MTEPNGNPKGFNHSDQNGAAILAGRLRAYWLDRGYNVRTTIEPIRARSERAPVFQVRSNLVGGLPPADSKIGRGEIPHVPTTGIPENPVMAESATSGELVEAA